MADASSDEAAALAAVWHQLEIAGIIQSVLCALFGMCFPVDFGHEGGSSMLVSFNPQGVYFVLFIIALWASYRLRSISSRRLRLVTIIL